MKNKDSLIPHAEHYDVRPIQEVYTFRDDFIDDINPQVGYIIDKFGLEKSSFEKSCRFIKGKNIINKITKGLTEPIF